MVNKFTVKINSEQNMDESEAKTSKRFSFPKWGTLVSTAKTEAISSQYSFLGTLEHKYNQIVDPILNGEWLKKVNAENKALNERLLMEKRLTVILAIALCISTAGMICFALMV